MTAKNVPGGRPAVIGKCPSCRRRLRVSEYVETVICRWCGDWFHPEQLQDVERDGSC